MSITLRPYQQKIQDDVYDQWRHGHRKVIAVAPTGAGKTRLMSSIAKAQIDPAVGIAHRQELVSQISMAMAENDVHHHLIAPDAIIRHIIMKQVKELGRHYVNRDAPYRIAGVDTLLKRDVSQWSNNVRLWKIDEAHHVLDENKWGKAVKLFPNAFGLGVTATPTRADKKSLHVDQGGVFNSMVQGPTMRDLINEGWLCDYRIFAPPASIDRAKLSVGKSGDFNQQKMKKEAEKSTITGDVVEHWFKLAPGKRTIVFATDVEKAYEIASAFRLRGVNAVAVDAKSSDSERDNAVSAFRRGEIKVLVNVDLFGEGFDVPGVECVVMARPTQSYGLYVQQFGRALRLLTGKLFGIIIDMVGNVVAHGLPDAPREWNLWKDETTNSRPSNSISITACLSCFQPFEAYRKTCPWCGFEKVPEGRDRPSQVDGDLMEMTPELLAQLRGEIIDVNNDWFPVPEGMSSLRSHLGSIHSHNQSAQRMLREAMALWSGIAKALGATSDSEIQRKFYLTFGSDMLTAQGLKAKQAIALTEQIRETYT